MKIFKIEIENYRLLKKFKIDLEDELSLVIGKNNTGKTSILSALEKFLNQSERNKFAVDDFNLVFKTALKPLIVDDDNVVAQDYPFTGISLKLFIEYKFFLKKKFVNKSEGGQACPDLKKNYL